MSEPDNLEQGAWDKVTERRKSSRIEICGFDEESVVKTVVQEDDEGEFSSPAI
ncbi:MAG: hypothetical protein AAFY26_03150 [Cyanobacteria bacterium J06638_22]